MHIKPFLFLLLKVGLEWPYYFLLLYFPFSLAQSLCYLGWRGHAESSKISETGSMERNAYHFPSLPAGFEMLAAERVETLAGLQQVRNAFS